MPMLSNARSTTPSPVSTTSDNLIPRKFSYGLLSHTGHSWGSLISSVWFEPLAPAPRGRFLPLAPAKTVQAVRRAHLEAFKTGRDRRPVRNIERMLDAPLHTGAVSIAKYAAAMRNRPANRLLIGRYRAIPYHDRGGLCRPRWIEHVPL